MPNFFYTDASGQKRGPITDQQLRTLAAQRHITPQTPLETDSGHEGLAGQVPGLFASSAPANPFTVTKSPTGRAENESLKKPFNLVPVIVIIGVLLLVGVGVFCFNFCSLDPAVDKSEKCRSNLSQISKAIDKYHDAHGALPPLYSVDRDGKPLHSWRVLLLPFLGETKLYQKIRLDEPWDSEYNEQFHNVIVSVYRCPANKLCKPGAACTYSAVAGEGFIPATKEKPNVGHTFAAIEDGVDSTLAVVEVKEPFCWMAPTVDITLDDLGMGINKGRVGSFHPQTFNVALFHGTRFVSNDIDTANLVASGTIAGGESWRSSHLMTPQQLQAYENPTFHSDAWEREADRRIREANRESDAWQREAGRKRQEVEDRMQQLGY